MVTLSRLYLRGVREGESRAHLLPPGAAATSAAGALRPAPLPGKVPGTCFSGTSHLLPYGLRLGWERGAAAGRAGPAATAPRPRGRRAGRGALGSGRRRSRGSCREHFGGARRFRGGTVPRSTSREHEAAGPGSAGGWRLLPGPCPPPRRERVPSPPPSRLLPSQPVAPRPVNPSRGPERALGAGRPMDVDAISAAPEREGMRRVVALCRGFSRASPRVRLSEPDWCVLRAGVPQRVRWVPPAGSVPGRSLSKLCGES